LIATYKTTAPAVSVSKGLDRDRAVAKAAIRLQCSGGADRGPSISMTRMYLRGDQRWTVTNTPPARPATTETSR
jgi:hypothetical protein